MRPKEIFLKTAEFGGHKKLEGTVLECSRMSKGLLS